MSACSSNARSLNFNPVVLGLGCALASELAQVIRDLALASEPVSTGKSRSGGFRVLRERRAGGLVSLGVVTVDSFVSSCELVSSSCSESEENGFCAISGENSSVQGLFWFRLIASELSGRVLDSIEEAS